MLQGRASVEQIVAAVVESVETDRGKNQFDESAISTIW